MIRKCDYLSLFAIIIEKMIKKSEKLSLSAEFVLENDKTQQYFYHFSRKTRHLG